MNRIYNFNAGPAILPVPVLEEASRGVLGLNGSGMSILEVSHRGKDYEKIHFDARDRLLRLLGLSGSEFEVLFLGGGASLQFAMVPMNFLVPGQAADFIHTGEWSKRAIEEARRFGEARIAGSSEAARFSELPRDLRFTPGARYAHVTTNNTIEGTEFARLPDVGSVPLIGDVSSNFLGRAYPFEKFSLFYAGAQKNAGPAGVTIVVARKSFLASAREDVPTMLAYSTHTKNDSLYNTPPAFGVFVVGLVARWLEEQGGIAKIEQRNARKAGFIYSALDEFPEVYEPAVTRADDRSRMNITWRLRDAAREKEFLALAQSAGMEGLKGHRSVGGFRASVYNAFPEDGCVRLAELLRGFALKG